MFWSLLLVLLLRICETQETSSNSVVGEPYVSCAADAVYLKFRTNATFEGHVNVKYTPNKYCYQVLVTNNQVEVLIPHEECAVSRRRSFKPAGVILEVVLSVSFHPEFTTINDKNFNFNCFHVQKVKGNNSLGNGSSTIPTIKEDVPRCSYNILSAPGGNPVGTVAVGQVVYHEWKCEAVQDSCLLVRNCALVGGQNKHLLIGEDGCSNDVSILKHLVYANKTYVSQNVTVFGLTTSSLVYFECEVILKPSTEGSCTHPVCDDVTRSRRSIEEYPSDSIMEIRSQRIEVSELAPPPPLEDIKSLEVSKCTQDSEAKDELFCVSNGVVVFSLVFFTCTTLFVLFLISMAMLHRYRYYNVADNVS